MYIFILKNKCLYVYLISLGSISVRFCFSISCMISVHSLSHGSSSAFLHDQFTQPLTWFLLCFLVWSVYTASHMVPPLLSCMISLHGLSHGSSSAFLYDQCTQPLTWFLLCFLAWSVYTASHMVPPLLSCMISLHGLSHGSSSAFLYDQFTRPLTWFLLCFLVWSVYTASHMVPPLLSACTQFGLSVSQYFFDLVPRDSDRTGLLKQSIPADLASHVFCTHRHSFDTEVSFSNLYWNPSYFIPGLPRFVKKNVHTMW